MPGELILIVEDEARIADLLERGLQAAGYRTERAATGRRALELWRVANPNLILLDLMIPEPGGRVRAANRLEGGAVFTVSLPQTSPTS
jgi:DNA-binding response OmpR family regulator